MEIHPSILAWKIPWTEAPGGLQSIGLQRVGHNWATLHTRNNNADAKIQQGEVTCSTFLDFKWQSRVRSLFSGPGSSVLTALTHWLIDRSTDLLSDWLLCCVELFALETNQDHSVAFEIASRYCISDSFVDYRATPFLLRILAHRSNVLWIKFTHSCLF